MSLADRIDEIVAFREFAEFLAAGLRENCRDSASEEETEREFVQLIGRVEGAFETSPLYPVVLQFLRDESRLTDDQLAQLFLFIYASLVNNFKGELAETLSRPAIRHFRDLLDKSAEVVLGHEVAERSIRGGWAKGADALICRQSSDRVEILGVVEIKSMRRGAARIVRQIRQHLARMRSGVRLRDEMVAPGSIDVTIEGARVRVIDASDETLAVVPGLIVRPWIAAQDDGIVEEPGIANVWSAELPYAQDDITEAAYRFTTWYFSRLGAKVFRRPEDEASPDDPRLPAPHHDLTLEENGRQAFIAAFYWSSLRKRFLREEPPRRGGRPSAREILLRLYNGLAYGYERATPTDIILEESPQTESGKIDQAQRAAAAKALAEARFADARAAWPDPARQQHLWTRRRDWLMIARLEARSGRPEDASAALSSARAEPPTSNRAISLEIATVDALIAIARNDREAMDKLREAARILDDLREQVREHENNGWGFPKDIDLACARQAAFDFAVAAALLGELVTARDALLRLRFVSDTMQDWIAHDPALEPVLTGEILQSMVRRAEGLAEF
jgi:hypothetical protein